MGGQSAPVPESLQRLWWAGGQSGPEGRTVRDRSREIAEALVGWRTVRPRWADGPPLYFKSVPERVSNWCGLQSLTADSPVFEPRTVRDFAEKSVTASFWRDVYIYPMPGHWVTLLAIWIAFLTH